MGTLTVEVRVGVKACPARIPHRAPGERGHGLSPSEGRTGPKVRGTVEQESAELVWTVQEGEQAVEG